MRLKKKKKEKENKERAGRTETQRREPMANINYFINPGVAIVPRLRLLPFSRVITTLDASANPKASPPADN